MDPFVSAYILFALAGIITLFIFGAIAFWTQDSPPIIVSGIMVVAILSLTASAILEKENNTITCTFKGGVYIDQKCIRDIEEIPLK